MQFVAADDNFPASRDGDYDDLRVRFDEHTQSGALSGRLAALRDVERAGVPEVEERQRLAGTFPARPSNM